jgi:hypothetical protein
MKTYLLLIVSCFTLFACSRKTIPPKTNNVTVVPGNNNPPVNNEPPVSNDSAETVPADSSAAVNNSALAFMVISNGYGKIITPQDSLPANATVQFDQLKLSKGFSAQELRNLKARYKTIPPRVLYVNPQNEQKSARGSFYVLGKKFWYWKKKDGLFYLDEKYYL